MEGNTIKFGMALGSEHFAAIAAKSERWKKRNVPAYIRESLFVPHYIVEQGEYRDLYIIQLPITPTDRVHFIKYARSRIDEEECTQVCDCQK